MVRGFQIGCEGRERHHKRLRLVVQGRSAIAGVPLGRALVLRELELAVTFASFGVLASAALLPASPLSSVRIAREVAARIVMPEIERGEFHFPRANMPAVAITREQLLRLLSGLSIAERKRA